MPDYNTHMDDPALIRICESCKHKDCIGICDEYRDKWRELNGYQEATRHRHDTNNVRPWQKIPAFGKKHTLAEWSRITGISYYKLYRRVITNHWNMEKALTYKIGGGTE